MELNEDHKEYLEAVLAINSPLNDIKRDFETFFSKPNAPVFISGAEIMEFKRDNEERIKKRRVKELNNLGGVSLANSRVMLEAAQQMFLRASEVKGRRSYPVTSESTGLTTYKEVEDSDHVSAEKWLAFIQRQQFFHTKVIMEMLSRNLNPKDHPELASQSEGIPTVKVYSGFEDRDDLLLEDSSGQEAMD